MLKYWIDSNVFIQAANGPYGFDIAPGFWVALDRMTASGQIASSLTVYDELLKKDDKVAKWARERRTTALFVEPDEGVQTAFREVTQHVQSEYAANQAAMFLSGADPWLIAHAMASGGKVVTQEPRVGDDSTKVKIPNVCDFFGVESLNVYDMLRELGVSIG